MGARQDLTGNRYNLLTVVSAAPSQIRPSGGRVAMWNCICDCGKQTVVPADSLRRGKIKSCGCLIHKRADDLTGQRFGRLQVIEKIEERSRTEGIVWKCLCDCGNATIVSSKKLKGGVTQSCGCLRDELSAERRSLDLTGVRSGKLTVLRKSDMRSPNGFILWECQCDCGRIATVRTSDLKSGKTRSCGCINPRTGVRIEYERVYGKIPKGYKVTTLDGDLQNHDIGNLYAMKAEDYYKLGRAGMNFKGLPDAKLTAIMLIELERTISEVEQST